MRTTLTLDDDVAVLLERLRKVRGESLRDLVNRALRAGLQAETEPPPKPKPFRTRSVDLGRSRLADVDDVAEALALGEGESFR